MTQAHDPDRRGSRGRHVVRVGWLSLAIVAAIALGATQAGSRPPKCDSDRDCRHLRNASCGDAGVCVQHVKPDAKAPKPAVSACKKAQCEQGTFCVEKSGKAACIDPCDPNPCLNGGSCEGESAKTAVCTCPPGWIGDNCGELVDNCLDDPCENGGSCINLPNNFECSCAPGWTGTTCDTDIDECRSSPCQPGATCINQVGGYDCE